MSIQNTDKFLKVSPNTGWRLDSSGISDASVASFGLDSASGLPTDTAVLLTVRRVDASGNKTPAFMERIVGIVSGNSIVSCIRGVEGTAQAHPGGSVVEIVIASEYWNRAIAGILAEHNPDGTHTSAMKTGILNSVLVGVSRQAIINGGFTVNQRGYVSNAVLAAGAYGHDRWKAGASGGDYTFTQLAQSTQITIKSGKSLIQVVEDKNVVGGTYTLSWTGTAQARFGKDSATPSGAYASSPITITGQTAGTILSVEFNEGTLGKVQLNVGSVALPFQPKSFEEELRACQRYFEKSFDYSVAPADGAGYNGALSGIVSATNTYPIIGFIKYSTRKRIAVNPILYNPSTSNANKVHSSIDGEKPGSTGSEWGESGSKVYVNNSACSVNASLYVHWTADAEL